ncbi:MAG: peptidoglycan-binding domain-containing protein [Pseudomonadota bacterium]
MIKFISDFRLKACAITGIFLSGCTTYPEASSTQEPLVAQFLNAQPPTTPNSCWDKITGEAIVETVEADILVVPEKTDADGKVIQPAVYRKGTEKRTVSSGTESWFEVPCSTDKVPDFINSMQRALQARGFYSAPLTGELDEETRMAVRAYQQPRGLDSDILSLAAARELGLVKITSTKEE